MPNTKGQQITHPPPLRPIPSKKCFSEFKIAYKRKAKADELPVITQAIEAVNYLRQCFKDDELDWRESLIVVTLDRSCHALGFFTASIGGVSETIVDPKTIFQFALLVNASAIIIAHNHPSGSLKPSNADVKIAKLISDAGKVLQIKLMDSIIITREGYYSFADEGLIFI